MFIIILLFLSAGYMCARIGVADIDKNAQI